MNSTNKNQILIIGGGEAFENQEQYLDFLRHYPYDISENPRKSWKNWLLSGLSDIAEGIKVAMPDTSNSYYPAWKIWFEKYFQFLGEGKIILIGHSLGGIFLTKYLSENHFPKKICALHLIAPVFDNTGLNGESTATFAIDPEHLDRILSQIEDIHLWHSRDDTVVPFHHSEHYHEYLKTSTLHTFEDRGHFSAQPHFVELFLEIQKELNL